MSSGIKDIIQRRQRKYTVDEDKVLVRMYPLCWAFDSQYHEDVL